DALTATGLLSQAEHATIHAGYDFLRLVESRLRIVHNRSLDELPESAEDLEKLARRLGFEAAAEKRAGSQFLEAPERQTTRIRNLFLGLIQRERDRQNTRDALVATEK